LQEEVGGMNDVGGYIFAPLTRGKGYKAHIALGITNEGYVSGGVDGAASEVEYLFLDLFQSILDRDRTHALLILKQMTKLVAASFNNLEEVEAILDGTEEGDE
jgi:hypothetical protein